MKKDIMEAIKERRSIYEISKESPLSNDQIQEIIENVVMHAPTAFHSQGSRVIILLGENHEKLWDLVLNTVKDVTPPDRMEKTERKIEGFRNGYGTVAFFENMQVLENLQDKLPLYADQAPIWAHQSMGMLQYAVWIALESEGLGASLQHYNPLIDQAVKEQWDIPDRWKLTAQMPFGKMISMPDEKPQLPVEERVIIFE